jgi:hypothetical protein
MNQAVEWLVKLPTAKCGAPSLTDSTPSLSAGVLAEPSLAPLQAPHAKPETSPFGSNPLLS